MVGLYEGSVTLLYGGMVVLALWRLAVQLRASGARASNLHLLFHVAIACFACLDFPYVVLVEAWAVAAPLALLRALYCCHLLGLFASFVAVSVVVVSWGAVSISTMGAPSQLWQRRITGAAVLVNVLYGALVLFLVCWVAFVGMITEEEQLALSYVLTVAYFTAAVSTITFGWSLSSRLFHYRQQAEYEADGLHAGARTGILSTRDSIYKRMLVRLTITTFLCSSCFLLRAVMLVLAESSYFSFSLVSMHSHVWVVCYGVIPGTCLIAGFAMLLMMTCVPAGVVPTLCLLFLMRKTNLESVPDRFTGCSSGDGDDPSARGSYMELV
jgi:hypothetical protein